MSSARVDQALGDVLEQVIDHRGKTPGKLGGVFENSGIPVVSAIHIKGGQIKWDERKRFVSSEMYEKWMPEKLHEGDLLLTSEAPLGEVALVKSDDPLVLSQRLFALRGKKGKLDTTYLFYFLQSAQGQQALRERSSGTTVSGIRQSELLKIQIPLPLFREQVRIAGVLKSLDDLILNNQHLCTALIEIQGTIYSRSTLDPDKYVNFGEVAQLATDKLKPGTTSANQIYLGLEHFGENGIGLIGQGESQNVSSLKNKFKSGDVLYGKLRPYFRKVTRPKFDGVCSTEIWVLRSKTGFTQSYLEWIVSSKEFTNFAMSGSDGTRMPRASWEHVSRMPVPYLSDQKQEELEIIATPLWLQYWSLREEISQLTKTRNELLPPLLSGGIRVKGAAA